MAADEPPIWGGSGQGAGPGAAEDSTPAPKSHRHRRAPRKSGARRYFLLAAAVLGVVVVGTLLFGALNNGTVSPNGEDPEPLGTPSSSVIASPTAQATTAKAEPASETEAEEAEADSDSEAEDEAAAEDDAADEAEEAEEEVEVEKAPVLVLNNSRIGGLAARYAGDVRDGGWTVTRTDNWTRTNLTDTTIFYSSGNKAAAEAFAAEFGFVDKVARALDGMDADLTLVLTSSAA